MIGSVFLVVLSVLLAGCGVDPLAPLPRAPDGWAENLVPDDPGVRSLAVSTYTGIEAPLEVVLEDEAAWADVWADWTRVVPAPAPPHVDFDHERVIVAAMGGRASGGYHIGVETVAEHAQETLVEVFTVSPGEGCVVTAAITAPAVAIAIPASPKPVRFATTHYVQDCE